MPNDVIISVRNVKRRYMMGEEVVWALAGVNLDVFRGEYMSIMGPSGSGKSTLFNMIGGLDRPTEGQVLMDGHDVRGLDPRQIAYLRCHKVGFIFQTFNLVQVMTAEQNVMLPLTFAGKSDEEAADRARQLLDRVGLGKRYDHRPGQLSGGQQQRVAIARAMANDPDIILADEPTGNLDLKTGEEIIHMLERFNAGRLGPRRVPSRRENHRDQATRRTRHSRGRHSRAQAKVIRRLIAPLIHLPARSVGGGHFNAQAGRASCPQRAARGKRLSTWTFLVRYWTFKRVHAHILRHVSFFSRQEQLI